jgi:PhzF family phenazine biosynthesis protein
MAEKRLVSIYQVDAFTSRPFSGNPAAVCLLDSPPSEPWMQSVAAEMNLAETAFLTPRDDGFDLRWFTPTVEVDLCGHATLAAAHILWQIGVLSADTGARFHTRSGLLTARRSAGAIELDFPAEPAAACEPPAGLRDALGAVPHFTGRNRMDVLVEVESADILRRLRPDFRRLAEIEARGIIATCRSVEPDHDFLSRFFAPASGIDEDPVTGSAHCCLGPYWQQRLGLTSLTGYQASRRGGTVGVRMEGDRVILIGEAVTVMEGRLTVATSMAERSLQDGGR